MTFPSDYLFFQEPQTRSNCNRSETPQVPKGIFAKLRQKYLANSTKPGQIYLYIYIFL